MIQPRIFQALRYIILAGGALFLVLLLRGSGWHRQSPSIWVGDRAISVTIADTDYLRELGLSGTKNLEKNTGKLFIFDHPGLYSFWMKDMQYPLDIVWIDQSGIVVGITPHIAPETYPKSFLPPSPVLYVLEINSDEAQSDGLVVGAKIQLPKSF